MKRQQTVYKFQEKTEHGLLDAIMQKSRVSTPILDEAIENYNQSLKLINDDKQFYHRLTDENKKRFHEQFIQRAMTRSFKKLTCPCGFPILMCSKKRRTVRDILQ